MVLEVPDEFPLSDTGEPIARQLLSALTMAIIRWVALTRGTDAVDRINILSQFANIRMR